MSNTIEPDIFTLQKICWLIAQQWKAELAYSRAQYRVSYYRKLKAKKTSKRWSQLELTKKIEAARLDALKKQEVLLDTKNRLIWPILDAKHKLGGAELVTEDGKVVGVCVPTKVPRAKWLFHDADEIADMADQYEAQQALNKILARKDSK
jgi:hypothetical protein